MDDLTLIFTNAMQYNDKVRLGLGLGLAKPSPSPNPSPSPSPNPSPNPNNGKESDYHKMADTLRKQVPLALVPNPSP